MVQGVYIIGTAMMKFGKYLEKGVKTLAGQATDLALIDRGLERRDMKAEYVSEGNIMYGSKKEGIIC
jgi:acetyl-CoA acetyltransferase